MNDAYNDAYPDDEESGYDCWTCTKCGTEYVDPEDFPMAWKTYDRLEVKQYWLTVNEPVCESCAIEVGIPSIDED